MPILWETSIIHYQAIQELWTLRMRLRMSIIGDANYSLYTTSLLPRVKHRACCLPSSPLSLLLGIAYSDCSPPPLISCPPTPRVEKIVEAIGIVALAGFLHRSGTSLLRNPFLSLLDNGYVSSPCQMSERPAMLYAYIF